MISLSSGLLCATNNARATKALSLIFNSPDVLNRCLFFSRNHINKKAPILLFPSVKGWFFITKYKRCAACSYILLYRYSPSKVCTTALSTLSKPWSLSLPNNSDASFFFINCFFSLAIASFASLYSIS